MLNGILNGVGKIVHWINAPLIPCVVMAHTGYTINNRVSHIDIWGSHIDLSAKHLLTVLILSFLHLLKQAQIFLYTAVPVRTFLARSCKIASVFPDLLCCQIADKGLSLLN